MRTRIQGGLDSRFTRTLYGTGLNGDFSEVAVLERADPKPTQEAKRVITSKAADYTLEELLGVGGMGEVWKASCMFNPTGNKDESVDTAVAMKFVTGMDPDSELKQKLVREARLMAQLHHDNIVGFRTWDYHEKNKSFFIVMEYVKGTDITRLMEMHGIAAEDETRQRKHLLQDRLIRIPDKVVGFILFSVANALEYAHNYKFTETRGVFHRDISPGNILIKTDEGAVKLGDFGIAATPSELEGDERGIISGKLPYISPEGIRHSDKIDARSDLYSLGVVMYEMLTGIRPNETFNPENRNFNAQIYNLMQAFQKELVPPHKIVEGIDETLSKIVCRMLETDHRKRFQTADELRHTVGNQFIYEKGYGPTKFGLRDYIKIVQGKENITEKDKRNIRFLKKTSEELSVCGNHIKSVRGYHLLEQYDLTIYARERLEKGENPARA